MGNSRESVPTRLLERARPFRPFLHVALFLLTICAVIAILNPGGVRTNESRESVLLSGLVFSLVNLLGIWAGLGTARWTLRMLGLLVGSAVLGALMITFWPPGMPVILMAVLEIALVALLAFARWRGVQFCMLPAGASPPVVDLSKASQFSIGDLLLWTAGFAAVFGVTQHMSVDIAWLRSELFILFAMVNGSCLLDVCILWTVFGAAPWPLRLVVLLTTAGALSEWFFRSEKKGPPNMRPWLYAFVGLQAAITAAVLFILRVHGYRIERQTEPC